MSQRDDAIVVWHEVPGASATQKNRPVGHGMIRAGLRTDSMIEATEFGLHGAQLRREIPLVLAAPDHTVTLRDGSLGGRFPRHFVPGYDHAVHPGRNTFRTGALIKLASMG